MNKQAQQLLKGSLSKDSFWPFSSSPPSVGGLKDPRFTAWVHPNPGEGQPMFSDFEAISESDLSKALKKWHDISNRGVVDLQGPDNKKYEMPAYIEPLIAQSGETTRPEAVKELADIKDELIKNFDIENKKALEGVIEYSKKQDERLFELGKEYISMLEDKLGKSLTSEEKNKALLLADFSKAHPNVSEDNLVKRFKNTPLPSTAINDEILDRLTKGSSVEDGNTHHYSRSVMNKSAFFTFDEEPEQNVPVTSLLRAQEMMNAQNLPGSDRPEKLFPQDPLAHKIYKQVSSQSVKQALVQLIGMGSGGIGGALIGGSIPYMLGAGEEGTALGGLAGLLGGGALGLYGGDRYADHPYPIENNVSLMFSGVKPPKKYDPPLATRPAKYDSLMSQLWYTDKMRDELSEAILGYDSGAPLPQWNPGDKEASAHLLKSALAKVSHVKETTKI